MIRTLLIAAAVAAAAPTFGQNVQSRSVAPNSWGRIAETTAARNFGDANGAALTQLQEGQVVRIHGTTAGIPPFHEVEVAGGVPVWVWGDLLQPTAVAGVVRVDASHVNMRPFPESSPRSMALRSKLQRGTRLLVIERQNEAKPLAEDWVQVWAPENARVWVEADDITVIRDQAQLAAAQEDWLAAQRRIPTQRQFEAEQARRNDGPAANADDPVAQALEATPEVPPAALTALTEANRQYDALMATANPTADDWIPVLALYEEALELAPSESATAQHASVRQKEVELRVGLAEVRDQMRLEDEQRRREIEAIEERRAQAEQRNTVHQGRFLGRGWLQARNVGGQRRYYIEWSGETTAEIRCESGRYDLDMYDGIEIGLIGNTLSPAVAATATTDALPRILDAYRIEVLSASLRR